MNLPKKWIFPVFSALLLMGFFLIGKSVVKSIPEPTINIKQIFDFKELLPTPAPYPINQNLTSLLELTAESVIALDIDSMATLYEKNPDLKHFPASTTKIMTALVVMDNFSFDQVLTASSSGVIVEGNTIKILPNEQLTVENLLYGLLVGSGNDAALLLSKNYPGRTTAFVEAMNKKAENLKLLNTHFTNPIGFDEEGHFSTAKDLARLAAVAIKNPEFSKIVSTSGMVITDVSGETTHFLKNTNELVGKLEGVVGVKTGWTENAGECLITLTERNGEKVLTVILGSKDRFGETKKLIEWIFTNFTWQKLVPASYH